MCHNGNESFLSVLGIALQSVDVFLCVVLCDDGVTGVNNGLNGLTAQVLDHGLNCEISHVVRVLGSGHGHFAFQDCLCRRDLASKPRKMVFL